MVEYESTLNLCGSLLVIILIGFLYGISNHYKKGYVVIINNLIFIVILPCHIFTALRKQDWFDAQKKWEFIASFLVLRIFMLLISIIITLLRKQSIFECVSIFLATSWISTIILGLPLCSSIFGPTYMLYGIYAALSSFFFQLPFMIGMFEIQKTIQQYQITSNQNINSSNSNLNKSDNEARSSFIQEDAMQHKSTQLKSIQITADGTYEPPNDRTTDIKVNIKEKDDFESEPIPGSLLCRIIKLVLWAWFKNPIAWAIIWGFFFAFIWSGTDLDQSKEDTDWPTFIDMAMNPITGLGTMTSPLGVLVIGLFAADQFIDWWKSDNRSWMKLFKKSIYNYIPELLLYLFLKFFICPAIMCAIVAMFGFDDKLSRIGVIIAVIPTSLASFILAKKYELKTQNVHALNVIFGTILMFPFVMMWLKIMDGCGLFPDWK